MISVIVYGRNDVHGYNAHRRAALSLNCLAEVLTDPDDEIVFVDYNSPDGLPTLVEALADTLTDRCLSLLRVLRVRADTHHERFAARTHLPIIEPVCRNVAARRSNPSNRWVLSTTTDMILLPHDDRSLTDICRDLPDGFYGLPRFELPEWLWERLPRTEPALAMSEIARLGPGLRLDETTVSHEEIRFDAPGDFQLLLRDDFFAIDGFDEAMVLGWHVDSNLSKRMLLRRGSIETLEESLAGYHCNHHRTQTVYHGTTIANDLGDFVHRLDRVDVPAQRATWGLADVDIEEVVVSERVGGDLVDAVLAAVGSEHMPSLTFDARDAKFALEYDSRHVLAFVADALSVSSPRARIVYVGANRELERMLAQVAGAISLGAELDVVTRGSSPRAGEEESDADVFVVDLGIDSSLLDEPLATATGPDASQARAQLIRSFDSFRQLVEVERSRLERGDHERRFVLVNSTAVYWNAYVLAHLHCGSTTPHSRVRQATVKLRPSVDETTRAADVRALRLLRWIARQDLGRRHLHLRVDEPVVFADLDDYGGFGQGWSFPDAEAVWTRGPRSELSIALDAVSADSHDLTLTFDAIGVSTDEPLGVALLANGAQIASWFGPDSEDRGRSRTVDEIPVSLRRAIRRPIARVVRELRAFGVPGVDRTVALARRLLHGPPQDPLIWAVPLPASLVATGSTDLTLVIEVPAGEWSDDRQRGLHLRTITLRKRGRDRRFGTIRDRARSTVRAGHA